jgi:fructokinase
MFDITTMGELLYDFSFCGKSDRGNSIYEANPGGAPANVAVGAKRLGAKTAFLGKIGSDGLSQVLKNTLDINGVDTTGLILSPDYNSTITFVQLDKKGDRSFSFYRNNTADINITVGDINKDIILNSRILHVGSVTLTDEPARSATIFAVKTAHENGLIVSYDPNFRPMLWHDKKVARGIISSILPLCDILKVSEEELSLITGLNDIPASMAMLYEQYNIPLIFTTLGADGSIWQFKTQTGKAAAFDVKTIDTTGAGDAFVAAVLYKIACVYGGIDNLSATDVVKIAEYASAASSLATTVTGAIPSLPYSEQVEILIAK